MDLLESYTAYRPMALPLGGSQRTLLAGPYPLKPEGYLGIKLAEEVPGEADVLIKVPDFGLPEDRGAVMKGLQFALFNLPLRRRLYVGCRGGMGRTGLFLALLVKALGAPSPIEYVRWAYRSEAVETEAQETYVEAFPINAMLRRLALHAKMEAQAVDYSGVLTIPHILVK